MLNAKQHSETAAARERAARVYRPADAIVNAFIKSDCDEPAEHIAYANNICEEIFQYRNCPAGTGKAFYFIMSNLFYLEFLIQDKIDKRFEKSRALFLKAYHTYANIIFEYVRHRQCSFYASSEIVKVALTANPNFDAVTAALVLIGKDLIKLGVPDEVIEKRLRKVRDYLSRPENKLTAENVFTTFDNFL